MAAGKFASLPRNMPVNHQFPLASSMDLLSSKSPLVERRADAYQDVSIHGTLPRKKKGPPPIRSCDNFSHVGTLPHSRSPRHHSPLIQDVIQEQPLQDWKGEAFTFRDQHLLDPTLEYVKFSKERHVMDRTPERLKKELEEELLLSSEDLRSHAWYHGRIPRQVSENLMRRDGDFLVRDSLSSPGDFVLTCQWKNLPQHFKIRRTVVRLSEAYSRVQYQFEMESFDSIPGLVRCYVGSRRPISQQSGAVISQPVNRTVPLRCLEERFGASSPDRAHEGSLAEGRPDAAKRLSLTVGGTQAREQGLPRGNLLRNKEKSGSQPACLDHMQDRRALSLKAHQSESYLPIGGKLPPQSPSVGTSPCPNSPVFRTGSEPTLSPAVVRRVSSDARPGEALRGSDSQLCPKPPPKPCKAPLLKAPPSPSIWLNSEANYCELNPALAASYDGASRLPFCAQDSYVELLTAKQNGGLGTRNSDTSYLILDDDDRTRPWKPPPAPGDTGREDQDTFVMPLLETTSSFKPNDFESKLLPPENKPLETSMLKRAKELFTNSDPKVIAQHLLSVDCKVARILEVSEEMRKNMGVNSGLELITLPYGHQLRLDIIERHNTMAIGIAVDILGCTGSLEDRAATLNKIIQVAVELKDSMGDLYSFSAIMKALEMPQITRLEKTWTALRHQYTQTAILYEKQLKPFSKVLHEGRESTCVPPNNVSVPLLMPLVTLMEREAVTFEGTDMWEKNDESCEIMLNHLATARLMAEAADSYRMNAERILAGFQPDEEMSEVFKTEFQMRLLWGSKGAQVNQTERYEKFNQILTALSRKLEPPPVKQMEF
ncbi:breast cancer anti-estrogen resistance protein 3 isoform X1 [Bubalus kerabau]|uniref:breast cancer anti-estrogen resistance protein 3 isoform X1 n=1 Tax=Bubalus carabanensis TaxID=3119969 RepID=UPI00244EB1F0|nr:breast cancer anti-estrogen resistance protein 3 isoform X1 [Bubalus carabanensis]XP_055441051.1 breast cancer anti-estrogen resistance protein 3 isoform X1 [Bubalus carabanensis]XP_055441052.1 breast cancer anti-estrogen resistance protein 3 isoform X1 [Bubalus carabanensis]XP_055441053.1 breast cancer anti-estrogen resistance protein 3 isoform X1 [Bubalus carabanensis]XP_055441054.1 breast cancer anti-estrogen resistance protein 3 isoform X1 [Bubalus carabanensis]XP_055441055.1 breast can